MSREAIVKEIINRFKLDKKSIKRLKDYEYELIYEALKNIDKELIVRAISDFSRGEFNIKTIRTTFSK